MKVLFGMALWQTTGFVESLLRLSGLDWSVPDFSTLSRRQNSLAVGYPSQRPWDKCVWGKGDLGRHPICATESLRAAKSCYRPRYW